MNICNAIAALAYPPILDIFFIAFFTVNLPGSFGQLSPVSAFMISFVFVCVIPFVPFPYFYKKGKIDLNVSDRHKRTNFYVIAVLSYLTCALVLFYFQAMVMFYLVVSFALIALAVMAVNFSWKISTHAAGIAGPVTAIAYVFGWQYLILHIFTAIVMWSRLSLKVHTKMQVLAGAALSVLITIAVFSAFMPL
jgi:membrane-associated phospholipid phosphatase